MLVIRFFGAPLVSHDDQPLTALTRSRILISLFAFLVMHCERSHARSVLASMFWPESPEAQSRRYLNTHLWRLRCALEQGHLTPAHYLLCDDEIVQFNPNAPFWLDVAEFQTLLTQKTEKVQAIEAALALYRAELLDGLYDDWIRPHRERLRERYLLALETLIKVDRASARDADALRIAQQLARAEPFYEAAHYQIVQLHAALGKPQEAHAHFKRYETIWRDELALEPSAHMVELRRQLDLMKFTPTAHDALGNIPLIQQALKALTEDRYSPEGDEAPHSEVLSQQIFTYAQRMGHALKKRHAHVEAETYFTLALEALVGLPESHERSEHQLAIRRELDDLYDWNAAWAKQAQNLQRAEQLSTQLDDVKAQAEVLARRAWMEMRHGQHRSALGHIKRMLDLCTLTGDRWQEAHAYRLMGIAYDELAELRTALRYAAQALHLDEAEGYAECIPNDLNNAASVEVTLGEYTVALSKLDRALALLTPQSSPLTRVMLVGNIGNIWTKLGQFAEAAECLNEAMYLARQLGDRETECWLGARQTRLYRRRGEMERALQVAHYYFQIAQATTMAQRMAELAELLSVVNLDDQDAPHALEWAKQANTVARTHGFWRYELRSAMQMAQAQLMLSQSLEAFAWAQQAITMFEQKAEPLEEAELYDIYAQSAQAVGHADLSASASRHARTALLKQANLIAEMQWREGFLAPHPSSALVH